MEDGESDHVRNGDLHLPVRLRDVVEAAKIADVATDRGSRNRHECGFVLENYPCEQFVAIADD